MADGAYAVDDVPVGTAKQLGAAGIAAHVDAVLYHPPVTSLVVVDIAGMRPHQPIVVTCHIRPQPSEDKVDHVHRAVAIAVILAVVHQRVDSLDGTDGNIGHIAVTLGMILAVVHGDGTHHVELRREQPVRIVVEIIAHAACEATVLRVVVALIAFLVHHVFHHAGIVAARELTVVELHEDDQAAEIVVVVDGLLGCCGLPGLCPAGIFSLLLAGYLGSHLRGLPFLHALQPGLLIGCALVAVVGNAAGGFQPSVGTPLGVCIEAVGTAHHGISILRGVEMQILITHQTDGEHTSVGLGNASCARMGGNSHCQCTMHDA